MTAKTIVITGASCGIGAAAAKQLNAAGHEVIVVGRNPAKTKAVAEALGVASYLCDFERLTDVRRLAAALLRDYPRIDALFNNAGAWFDSFELTADGFERTIQVNHLAPALLTDLLRPAFSKGAVLVWTSSMAARWCGRFDPARIGVSDDAARAEFGTFKAYGASKLAASVYVGEFDRRYRDAGIFSVSIHPGTVATSFGANTDTLAGRLMRTRLAQAVLTSPVTAARKLTLFLDCDPEEVWTPGAYYQGRMPKLRRKVDNPLLGAEVWDRTWECLTPLFSGAAAGAG
ncbi:MAG: SDR family NAD(P)-dependent oxidoreductase [Promicromonosporaceae bacterium]|nr:SDR family NAD(P)-dependent oxidoreductase [Promicromonosporaceae bacterium]